MRSFLPGDPGLPGGMVSDNFGGPDECERCGGTGELYRSDCCGAPMHGIWAESMECPACHANCRFEPCPDCDGSGVGEDEQLARERAEEDKADWLREEARLAREENERESRREGDANTEHPTLNIER